MENIAFTKRAQFAGSKRHVSYLFKKCVKTHLQHSIPFHEERCQRRVFCECWLLYLFLHWLDESVLSADFPEWSQNHPFYFRILKICRAFYVEDHVICKQWEFHFFSYVDSFYFFFCPDVANTSKTMLNRNGESGHPCLVPDFRGNACNFSSLRVMLAVGLSYIAFIMLRYVPSSPAFWRVLIINGCWILSKAFSASI